VYHFAFFYTYKYIFKKQYPKNFFKKKLFFIFVFPIKINNQRKLRRQKMDQNLGLIWERCLKFMRDNLSAAENEDVKKLEHSFDLLFDKVQPLSLVNHNLTLLVPSDFYKEYIEENYLLYLCS
jgi:chromosomal replication initiator protein